MDARGTRADLTAVSKRRPPPRRERARGARLYPEPGVAAGIPLGIEQVVDTAEDGEVVGEFDLTEHTKQRVIRQREVGAGGLGSAATAAGAASTGAGTTGTKTGGVAPAPRAFSVSACGAAPAGDTRKLMKSEVITADTGARVFIRISISYCRARSWSGS